jgi:curved DNA-binding protein CbpA
MADKTLYDILELDYGAMPEMIDAAYARLSAQLDPARAENAGSNEARIQQSAVKDAHFVLSNAQRRAHYDDEVRARIEVCRARVAVAPPHWTLPKVLLLAAAIAGAGVYYHHNRQEAMREDVDATNAAPIVDAAAPQRAAPLTGEPDRASAPGNIQPKSPASTAEPK